MQGKAPAVLTELSCALCPRVLFLVKTFDLAREMEKAYKIALVKL